MTARRRMISFAMVFLAVGFLSGCPGPNGAPRAGFNQSALATAREKGVKEAREAIAAGKLKLKEYPPLPSPAWYGEYVRLLREKCQVDYEVVSAAHSEALVEEVRGWNETMEAEIRRRFGPNILQELRDEGEKLWRQKKQ